MSERPGRAIDAAPASSSARARTPTGASSRWSSEVPTAYSSKSRQEYMSKSSARRAPSIPLDMSVVTETGPSADPAASTPTAGNSERGILTVSFDVDIGSKDGAGTPRSNVPTPMSQTYRQQDSWKSEKSVTMTGQAAQVAFARQATATKRSASGIISNRPHGNKKSLTAALSGFRKWTRNSEGLESDPSEASDFSFIMRDDDHEELTAYKECGFLGDDDSDASEGGIADNELMNANDRLSRALWYIRQQRNLLRVGNQGVVEEESRFKAWIEMDEILLLVHEEKKQRNMKRWARFDTCTGFFVFGNGVLLGITTQNPSLEESRVVMSLELGFLSLFTVEWCIRWYFKPTGFRGMIRDWWTAFDLAILLISFIDTVVLELLNFNSTGASLITVLRVFRLMRLIRLVRLLKLLKELWMLVSGMLVSVRILAWALFMFAVMCYIFGLFMVEMVRSNLETKEEEGDVNPELKGNLTRHWLGVPQTMLSMAQIATHSGHDLIRELNDLMGIIAMPVLFAFIFIASLGLLNLIVGVLLTTSLRLAHKDTSYQDTLTRLAEHRNLRALRELLIARCTKSLGTCTGSPFISRRMLLQWADDNSAIDDLKSEISAKPGSWIAEPSMGNESMELGEARPHSQTSDGLLSSVFKQNLVATSFRRKNTIESFLSRTSPKGLAASFAAAGITEDEINMIFNETDSVNGRESSISLDEFIDGCILLKGQVHELDVVNMMYGIRALYRRMLGLKSSLHSTLQALRESSEQVSGLLQRYHVSHGAKEEYIQDDDGPPMGEEGLRQASATVEKPRSNKHQILLEQETVLANIEFARLEERRNWDNFDFAFSIVVFVNAFVLGVEVTSDVEKVRDIQNPNFDAISTIWFTVDFIFFFTYVSELWLRLLFHYQMREMRDFRRSFKFLPKLVVIMDRETALKVALHSPRWFKDWRNLLWLDALVVAVTIVDNGVLRIIDGGGDDYSKTLKLIGLARLIRLARLLHLVRPLEVLVKGFIGNVKLIFWCLAMLSGLIYAGAISLVELVGKDPRALNDEAIQSRWAHVGTGMLTMAQIVTYNSWTERVEEMSKVHPWLRPVMLAFVCITSLGILNLVTGVMVQAAFRIVIDEGEIRRTHKLNNTKIALQEAMARAFRRAEKEVEEAREALRKRIRVLRQVILDSAVAADYDFVKNGRADSVVQSARPNLRRQGAQELGRGDQIAMDGLEEEAPDPTKGASVYNPTNYCIVVHSTWTAPEQVAIGIRIMDDGKHGPLRSPLSSILAWEGGRTTVGAFILDDDLTPEPQGEGGGDAVSTALSSTSKAPSVSSPSASSKDKKDSARSPSKSSSYTGRRHCKGPKNNLGELIFSEVPRNLSLRFRFGGNYSFIPVYPGHAPERTNSVVAHGDATLFGDEEEEPRIEERPVPLAHVVPVDKSVVTLRELDFLVSDPVLVRKLKQVDLRPEQAMMVFQIMNVNATGKITVSDFIEGLLRIRRHEVGLDTAGAKSLMRRLRLQVGALSKSAYHLSSCFTIAVQRLRGCSIIEQMDDDVLMDEETLALERRNQLAHGNEQLQRKITRLKTYLKQRKSMLHVEGGANSVHHRADDEEGSLGGVSIHSASPGWD